MVRAPFVKRGFGLTILTAGPRVFNGYAPRFFSVVALKKPGDAGGLDVGVYPGKDPSFRYAYQMSSFGSQKITTSLHKILVVDLKWELGSSTKSDQETEGLEVRKLQNQSKALP